MDPLSICYATIVRKDFLRCALNDGVNIMGCGTAGGILDHPKWGPDGRNLGFQIDSGDIFLFYSRHLLE